MCANYGQTCILRNTNRKSYRSFDAVSALTDCHAHFWRAMKTVKWLDCATSVTLHSALLPYIVTCLNTRYRRAWSDMSEHPRSGYNQGFIQDFTPGGVSKNQGVPLFPLPSLPSLPFPSPSLRSKVKGKLCHTPTGYRRGDHLLFLCHKPIGGEPL